MTSVPTYFIRETPAGFTVETDAGRIIAGPFTTRAEADVALRQALGMAE